MRSFLYAQDSVPDGIGMGSFGLGHFFWLVIGSLSIFLAVRYYGRQDEKGRKKVLSIVSDLLLLDELLKYIVTIPTGQWRWDYLPLHLCSISIFVILAHRLTGKAILADYLYCVSLPTALMALLFPNWTRLPFWNIMCFHSFTVHIMIMLYPILLLRGGFRPDIRRFPFLLALLFCMTGMIIAVNSVLGTNFFFMASAGQGNPLTILEDMFGGWYRLGFLVIAAVIWTPMYLIPCMKARKAG